MIYYFSMKKYIGSIRLGPEVNLGSGGQRRLSVLTVAFDKLTKLRPTIYLVWLDGNKLFFLKIRRFIGLIVVAYYPVN